MFDIEKWQRLGAFIASSWLSFLVGAVAGTVVIGGLYQTFIVAGLKSDVARLQLQLTSKPPPPVIAAAVADCTDYASLLARSDFSTIQWRFGRKNGDQIAAFVTLNPNAQIGGVQSPSETSWRIDGGKLEFLNARNILTTRFDTVKCVPMLEGAASTSTTGIVHVLIGDK